MTKEQVIKTDNYTLVKAEEFLNDFRAEYLIENNNFMNILIAFTEAVNNAINHGNRKNPKKNIRISIEKKLNKLKIEVKDEGEGFRVNEIPDPTLPENLLKQSGRGVFLIKRLADSMEIESNENGTLVKMGFNL